MSKGMLLILAKIIDVGVMKRIKDKDKNILVQGENIKDRWREYFDELFRGHVGDNTIIPLDKDREFM